jgi:hypothetical protein
VCGLACFTDNSGGLTQFSSRFTTSVVGKQPSDEEEPSIARKHAGERAIVEVRVVLNTLVPAVRGPLGHNIKVKVLARRHGVVQLLEAGRVHGPSIASQVQVVAEGRGVGFEDVVRVVDALGHAEQALGVVEDVVDGGRVAADGEGGGEGEGVAGPDDAHGGEQQAEVEAHAEDLVDGGDGVDQAGHAAAVDVAVVG